MKSLPVAGLRGFGGSRPDQPNEHDCVSLLEAVTDDEGQTVAEGTVGTIVSVWMPGQAFEVEFTEPQAILTLQQHQIRLHTRLER